ncbi:MAG: hypothetical protein ACRDQB_12875 [Thermocrispum sp.]
MSIRRARTGFIGMVVAVVALLGLAAPAYAELPKIDDAVTDVIMSPTTVQQRDAMTVTWRFNPEYSDEITVIELWLGHSSGMGHGPHTRVVADIDPRRGEVTYTVPDVAPSAPGNQWSVDLIWRSTDGLVELSSTPVTIQQAT